MPTFSTTINKTQFERRIIDSAVGELCKKTLDGSFNKMRPGQKFEYDSRTRVQEYLQSFMIGMMTCSVKANFSYSREKRLDWTKFNEGYGHVLKEVRENWPKCMKENLNEEIQTTKKVINILETQFIPRINDIMKLSKVCDEVAYVIQIHMSRYSMVFFILCNAFLFNVSGN